MVPFSHQPLTIATLGVSPLMQYWHLWAFLSPDQATPNLTPLLLCNPTTATCGLKPPMTASFASTFLLLTLFLPAVSNPLTLTCVFYIIAVSVPSSLKPKACSRPRCREIDWFVQKNRSIFSSLNTSQHVGLVRWVSLFTVECSCLQPVLSNFFIYWCLANNTLCGLFVLEYW